MCKYVREIGLKFASIARLKSGVSQVLFHCSIVTKIQLTDDNFRVVQNNLPWTGVENRADRQRQEKLQARSTRNSLELLTVCKRFPHFGTRIRSNYKLFVRSICVHCAHSSTW